MLLYCGKEKLLVIGQVDFRVHFFVKWFDELNNDFIISAPLGFDDN